MHGSQGAACYDGFLVIMSDSQYHKELAFVDMDNLKIIQSGKYDQGGTGYHNNSVFFGTEKYDVSDQYPVIYAAQGKTNSDHSILVYRIVITDGVYSLELVQTINTPAPSGTYKLYNNDAYLGKDGYLWLIGLDKSNGDNNVTDYVVAKFAMPTLSQGDVTLTESDALDYYTLPYQATSQAGCIDPTSGYLYKCRSAAVEVWDLQNHARLDNVSLPLGVNFEIETCFINNGMMYFSAITDESITESGKQQTEIWMAKFIKA
jgi:hypothetical protein